LDERDFWKKFSFIPSDDVPKYRRLSLELERLIRSGIVPTNAQLPGETEFMERLGISRTTVRKALDELEDYGLIFRNQGQGTFVGSKSEPSGGNRNPGAAQGSVIGLLIPNITNEIYPSIIGGIEENALRHGACLMTANSGGSRERESQLLGEMIGRSIDGLIMEPALSCMVAEESRTMRLLRSMKIPVVLIENDIPGFDCPKVMIDDVQSGETATRHLIAFGHKRIAYVYKDGVRAAIDRREGYRRALDEAGIERDPSLEFAYLEKDEPSYPGYRITREILGRRELGITAIFYFNDDLALQGLQAARELDVRVPEDISIVGHDDISRARMGDTPLTTMEHPQALLGRWAADLLFECMERPDRRAFRKLRIEPALLSRGTVAPPRK